MLAITPLSRLSYQLANFGYNIHNQYWGQGYATEACQLALEIGFKVIQLNRLEAGIEMKNKASINICKKLGMRREGLRKSYFFNGEDWVDLVYYTMTAEDFGVSPQKPRIKPNLQDYL